MKKSLIYLSLICGMIILSGCNNIEKYQEVMKEYATTFYNLHLKGQENQNSVTVSIAQLKEAVEVVKDDYDMTKLKKCKDDSYVELIIDEQTKEITNINYHLICD